MEKEDCSECIRYLTYFRDHSWPKCRVAEITGETVPTAGDKQYEEVCNMALDWNIHLQSEHCKHD